MLNRELWKSIEEFDFDSPPSEYCFSIRLAKENCWTKSFTERAITEYRKFMYLAATSDQMVSPSGVVDVVWHQHLIFTGSYQAFCKLIGKYVEHVPSTGSGAERNKFKNAKEFTKQQYSALFGHQPTTIWDKDHIFDSLNLPKAKWKLRSVIIIALLILLLLCIPAFFLLTPLYSRIGNPEFLWYIMGLEIVAILLLNGYNKLNLSNIVVRFDADSFIYSLKPAEVLYLQSQSVAEPIHHVMNKLVKDEIINVRRDYVVEFAKNGAASSLEELQITSVLSELGSFSYPVLLETLKTKPVFANTHFCMQEFRKYFIKSAAFNRLFVINTIVVLIPVLLAISRILIGLSREMPVAFITILTIVLFGCAAWQLYQLTKLILVKVIPDLYRYQILPTTGLNDHHEWQYFLIGAAALSATFMHIPPYIKDQEKNFSSGSGCGSDSGGSCGSSCGGCGGCGGD